MQKNNMITEKIKERIQWRYSQLLFLKKLEQIPENKYVPKHTDRKNTKWKLFKLKHSNSVNSQFPK